VSCPLFLETSDFICWVYPAPVVVIPLNPERMEIWEWVILFSENFEGMGMGMGMGMGNLKKLCA